MAIRCKSCNRPILSRRSVKCQFCGAAIPSADQFTSSQKEFLQRLKEDEAKKHREFMEREYPRTGGTGDLPTSL